MCVCVCVCVCVCLVYGEDPLLQLSVPITAVTSCVNLALFVAFCHTCSPADMKVTYVFVLLTLWTNYRDLRHLKGTESYKINLLNFRIKTWLVVTVEKWQALSCLS